MEEIQTQEQNFKWFSASLRFTGDDLPVDEIGEWLGVEPTMAGRKYESIAGRRRYAEYPTNLWVWEAAKIPNSQWEEQIPPILDLLESKREKFDEIQSIAGVEVELFLGFASDNGQGGGYFSAETLSRIGALGLGIILDLYPPGEI